ncbi:MAG: DUF423 domain-containing protein [Mucilaginibacter sp.]
MNKRIIITASILGMLAVVTGAFGAHGLKALITAPQLEVWHTAVQYQFYHVFALLFLSTFGRFKNSTIVASFYFFTFGIALFSGSLYLMSCKDILGLSSNAIKIIGPVTPIGGLLFILGWLTLAFAALRHK